MSEILNLRRARKARAKAEKDKTAEANRVLHGTPKGLRNLAKARKDKSDDALSGHRLDKEDDQNRSVGEVPADSLGTSDQK
jgi:hypothetical protein